MEKFRTGAGSLKKIIIPSPRDGGPIAAHPLEYLHQFAQQATPAFQALCDAVTKSGPLHHGTCEPITLGTFATARIEGGF